MSKLCRHATITTNNRLTFRYRPCRENA